MDNLPFFTDNNKDLLYNLCRDEIYKESQYNIDNNKKYYKTFGEIMKIVYKHSQNVNDLTQLNKEVLAKTIPYLNKEIEKKKLKNSALLPPQLNPNKMNDLNLPGSVSNVPNVQGNNGNLPVSFRAHSTQAQNEYLESVSNSYNQLLDNRDNMFKEPSPPNIDFTQNSGSFEPANTLMEKTLQNRREMNNQFNIPDNTISTINNQFTQNVNQGIDSNNVSINNQIPKSVPESRGMMETQNTQVSLPDTNNLTVQDFSVSDDMIKNLHNSPEVGTNLIKDMNTYNNKNNDVDPQILLKQYSEENKKQDAEFKDRNQSMIDFDERNKEENLNINLHNEQRDLQKNLEEQSFKDSLTFKIDQQMNNLTTQNIKGQFDHRIDTKKPPMDLPTANDLNAMQSNNMHEENKLFEELKKKLFKERNYVNKENLVIINSVDRDWFNEDSQNRYSFQVRFNPEPDGKERVPVIENNAIKRVGGAIVYETKEFKGDQGAGIQNIFKNIVSFELVRVLMPVENFIIPFDNRIFVDYKSLPYIVLNIEEIEGIYGGTNSNTNNAFAQLLWDKDHSSEVVIDTSILKDSKKKFSRELKRGFSSMAPMAFEKKTFYPTPLSSLNRLTISLETPFGTSILNHHDVIDIEEVSLLNMANTDVLDLDESPGFPFKADDNIIQIKTRTYFSNRVFKIGDNIRIKGFVSTQSDTNLTNEFINRPEGHYIINLQDESSDQATATANEGYINYLYISPPGNFTNTSTTTSVIDNTTTLSSSEEIYASGGSGVSVSGDEVTTPSDKKPSTVLHVGDSVIINSETKTVTSIVDNDNKFVVNSTFTGTPSGQAVTRERRRYFIETDSTYTCKLVNTSLQTHFVFKIVTREEDIHSHMTSSNV